MTLTIRTKSATPSEADGSYTYPSARELPEGSRPALLWREPMGREVTELRRLQARRRDAERAYLDERRDEVIDELDDEPDDWLAEVIPEEVVEETADAGGVRLLRDVEDDADLDDLGDDEHGYMDAYTLRRQIVLAEWAPPRDLIDEYLDWCVGQTVGVEHIEVGDGEPVQWDDDAWLTDTFGADAHEARRQIIDQFGEEPWERQRAAFQYAQHIHQQSQLDEAKKKH